MSTKHYIGIVAYFTIVIVCIVAREKDFNLSKIICRIKKIMRNKENNRLSKNIKKSLPENTCKTNTINNKKRYLDEEYLRIYHDIEFDFEKETQYYNNHCCPYCGIVFEKEIKTTKNCPYCKKKIIKRNNYLTKQNYLMTQDKFKSFEKYEKELQELNFYEEILKHISYNCSNLKEKILEKSSRNLNIRDLVWGLCNDLEIEYSIKGVNLINQCKNKPLQSKVFDLSEAKRLFDISNIYTLNMAKIAEHEDKLDISIDILCNYLHNQINIYMLEFTFCDLYEFKEERLIQSLNTRHLKEYLQNHSISIIRFEKYYKGCNRNFVIPIVDKTTAWKIIKTALSY